MKKIILSLCLLTTLNIWANVKITEATSGNSNAIANESCILSYQTKYDQLLPLEVIKKHYSVPAQAKKEYVSGVMGKKYDRDTYEYVWDSKRIRKMKLMGREMEMPSPNRIALSWVGSTLFMIMKKATPIESFKAFYRNTTAKEKEEALKIASEKMKKKGYDEKTTNTATSMAKELASHEVIFKEITGIGDAASWQIKDNQLNVLVGKITFQVVVEISENDEENIALAKKLAQEVLSKCK